jgi:hypothetical protein
MSKSYRIRTEVGVDKYINVNLEQDWESLEILSLNIFANNVYSRFCSTYGVVTGRVFVNGGYGLPNAKVSVFIPLDDTDELDPVISELYPFKTIGDTNEDGYRYNLLPKLPSYKGHASTGSFPNKSDVLMDESYIEVYDKYYRFTVTTNESGDFMIFGVPVGEQTIVMDVDLSDIGCFSMSPQDLILQGLATESQVNGARFKSSTNLRELPQIKNLIYNIDVRPFWGAENLCQVGITRADFDLTKLANITIQPSSIFMGSIISNTNDDALRVSCKPKNNTGNLCELVAGPGEIQGIRQTIYSDSVGLPILERWDIEQAGKVIDGDGTFLVNVPMNLDYIYTNEFGEQVISNDPKKGIPTKGKYRFKFKWETQQGLQGTFLRADFLVPNVKEHGWSNYQQDPFMTNNTSIYNYPTIPVGSTSGATVTSSSSFGLISPVFYNLESYTIFINGINYFGSPESIQITNGDTLQIVATPIDPTQPINIDFTQVPQDLFDVYKSYAFSTDWDDYADIQDAIDCEDTFYEFQYNKVYTTAMFLDRYKNGLGRAKHLGIKEIDDRSCRSNVNTFPVNDIIRNFDPIFFVFNILINILTFPLLNLLFVAHLIAFMWPILKYLLIILGIVLTKNAIYDTIAAVNNASDVIETAISSISASLAGPVIDVGAIIKDIRLILNQFLLILKAAFSVVLAVAFTAFAVYAALKVKGFPRIGLPMISYPDCTSCECDCKDAPLDDDFDTNSITNQLNQDAAEYQSDQEGGLNAVLSTPNSLIAPVNYSGSFSLDHPNLSNNEAGNEPFPPCESLVGLITANTPTITIDIITRASLDFIRMASGYDVLSSNDPNKYIPNEAYLLKAPQPFLFYADKVGGGGVPDSRYFAYPTSVTLSQRLNEFNTRDKYFYSSTANISNSGVNKIQTTVNPTLGSQPYFDQVLVVLMNQGSAQQLGIGELVTLQDPNYVNPNYTTPGTRLTNLTGATINQFQTNSITGTTLTASTIPITINYANPSGPNAGSLPANIIISGQSLSELPVPGDTTVEQSYLQYPTDMEYFQLITGMTFTEFITLSNTGNTGFFPASYLLHDMTCNVGVCGVTSLTYPNIIQSMQNYKNYEICIFVRGVDPHTVKQPTIQYDLSNIFGKSLGTGPIVSGSYYLNYPIQSLSTGLKPVQHDTSNNSTANLYFPSFTFTPNASSWTGFTSNYPYYYLNTDDNSGAANASNYSPYPGVWKTNQNSTISLTQTIASTLITNTYNLPVNGTSYYMVGGTYMRWVNNVNNAPMFMQTGSNFSSPSCNQDCQKGEYFNTGSTFYAGINAQQGNLTALYSPAYYRYTLPGVNFSNSNRIVMRSDRLPTSSQVQNGPTGTQTGYALHQNDNFAFYLSNGAQSSPTITAGFDLPSGEYQDLDPVTSALTETLTCEGMVPLECYSGSGSNVGVIPYGQCSILPNRMVNGCYCLLNYKETNVPFFKKLYLFPEYFRDARLFLEWKVRFTMNFAACRGVFAQVFQNNWINGSLYMFNFNKRTTFNSLAEPVYNYCENVIMFNEISNTFYYRSSPWDGNNFIGKKSPSDGLIGTNFPGYGYNKRQIQFPTTITDLGPRDFFINEVCCSSEDSGFGSYYANQIKTTSYQDNSDIVQLGFLSRILNEGVRQRILPIPTGDNNSEGLGIIQFFNSNRGGYRIDGDWAQMLSINSEWEVSPFITENVPNNSYIYFGDNQNGSIGSIPNDLIKPILGLFFSSSTEELRYRKIMSSGIETYAFNPLIEQKFGYPKSQYVPHYKWLLKKPTISVGTPNIFGSEDNNWYTDVYGNGFFNKRYQDLDFTSNDEKYQTSLTKLGFISSFSGTTSATIGPSPITPLSAILQGDPSPNPAQESTVKDGIVVGAPYHFYFGLNNGKTAVDRFYKLYVATEE